MLSSVPIDVSDAINFESKLGLFIWFESNFRNQLPYIHLVEIDNKMIMKFDSFDNNEIKNFENLEIFLFYNTLKSHYINMSIINNMFVKLYGDKFINKFKKYKYYENRNGFFQIIYSNILNEFKNIFMNEITNDDIKIPIITKDNYQNLFSKSEEYLISYHEIILQSLFDNKI